MLIQDLELHMINSKNDENENNEDVFYDVIAANSSYLDSEPTIIDVWRTFMRKCCCCKYDIDDDSTDTYRNLDDDSNFGSLIFEDEVEKAMKERNIRELRTALIENEMDKSRSSYASKSPQKESNYKSSARMRCYCIPCIRYKPSIIQLVMITVTIESLMLLIMATTDAIHDAERHEQFRSVFGTIIGFMLFLQLIVLVQLILICVKKLWHLKFGEILVLYLTSIFMFTGVYTAAYFFDDDDKEALPAFEAFNLNETQFKNSNFGERVIAFLYFSCSQQTLCGVCEIIPKSPPTMVLAAFQMLCGIFFSIIIISIGISRLGQDIVKRQQMMTTNENIDPNNDANTCWQSLIHNERLIKLRRTTRKYLLLIVIMIQATKNVFEWITSNASHDYQCQWLLFVIFDIMNILAVIITSLKFLHIGHMTELKISFLLQTYLSSMLIFTGVYVDLQISGDSHYDNGAFVTAETTYIGMWTKFTYFSFAIMTLCGAGLDIKPRIWYASIAVCVQMLLGLFFHVYIFGIGLSIAANKKKRRESHISQISHINDEDVGSELIMSALLRN